MLATTTAQGHEIAQGAAMTSLTIAKTWLKACMALLISASLAAPGAAVAQESASQLPPFLALVDGSGSMWGGLGSGSTSKLEATRQALESEMPRLASTHRLGLATFGPGCRAAALDVPLQEGNGEALAAALARFNPRGKGPLVAGMRLAADAIGPGNDGHVVIFHDGPDNCGEDACAAAASLHGTHPKLRISTISLGMEPATVAAIACIAKSTGGSTLTANDPQGLKDALSGFITPLLRSDPPKPALAAEMPARPQPAAKGPPRLVATAVLANGNAPLTMPMSWRILDSKSGKLLHEAVIPALTVPLPAGAVRIEVSVGRVKAARDVEIAAEGDTAVDIPLGAGIVRFDTGTKPLSSDAEEPIIRLESTSLPAKSGNPPVSTATTPLWIARGKAIEALLPPGDYQAIAEYGLARTSANIQVAAGQEINLALPLEAGRLELTTTPDSLSDVVYQVFIDDLDQPGGKRQMARTAHRAPAYILSTGTYTIAATSGKETIRRSIAVRSGETTRETIAFNLAKLEVTATINGAPPRNQPLTLVLTPKVADANAAAASRTEYVLPTIHPIELSPGTYVIALRNGADGTSASREITVAAGQDQRIELDLKTAEIAIDTATSAPDAHGAFCELRDTARTVVWRTVANNPKTSVAPGSYILRCQNANIAREVPLTLAAGDKKRIAPFAP